MPVDITDAHVFTDPIVRPADSDAADLTYIVTLTQGLANRTRWLYDVIGGVAYPYQRYIVFAPLVCAADSPGTAFGWGQANGAPGYAQSLVDSAYLPIDLGPYLPYGCTLDDVHVLLTPGAARSGASRMSATLHRGLYVFTGTETKTLEAIGSAVSDDTTSTIQSLAWTALAEAILPTRSYQLVVRAGNDGGTHTYPDALWAVRLTVTVPGPG